MPLPAAGATGILEVESVTMNQFSLGYLAAGIGAGLAVLGLVIAATAAIHRAV